MSLLRVSVAIVLLAGLAVGSGCARRARAEQIAIRPPREIEFPATVHAGGFDSGWSMPGYHAVVWKGGKMRHAALLEADVSDRDVISALEKLGSKPGNNLTMDTWNERKNPKNRDPDVSIAGSPVEMLLRLPGRAELVPLASVLEDSAGRGIELRYGGNAENIPKWKSGCIVCLYSCPGSKVGNARYTVRDYANGVTRFRVRKGILPPDGTKVGVVLRVVA